MTSSDSSRDLKAGDLPAEEDRRKRRAEGKVSDMIAGGMAADAVAAVTHKAKRDKPPRS